MQPEAPATTPPAAAPTFSEADVKKFANVLVAIDNIRPDYAASGATTPINSNPEATTKTAALVQESGLPFETYNAVAARMTADAVLNHRIAQ